MIITKADLAEVADDVVGKVILQAAGVDVVTTSAENGTGSTRCWRTSRRGTFVLLGPSGAGKSTLINALVGQEVQHTGEVRSGDFKGKHTTTSRELVPLPNGAVLMDTPGVRGFGLFDADVWQGWRFADVEELAGRCRFSDCAHQKRAGVRCPGGIGGRDARGTPLADAMPNSSANSPPWPGAPMPPPSRAYQREWHQKVVVAGKSQRSAERDSSERRDEQRSKRKRR